jgi:hypothetical protein
MIVIGVRKFFVVKCAVLFCLLLSPTLNAELITYFEEVDITIDSGDPRGIQASATATITTGAGWMDVVIQNTSPLGPDLGLGNANPFITELEFKNLPGFDLDFGNSYVESLDNSYFAHGKDNAATLEEDPLTLNYSIVAGDHPGMDLCFMGLGANNIENDNTILSMAVLDPCTSIPLEAYAEGFLNDDSANQGAVFDAARFHFEYTQVGTPDGSFYTDASTLTVKFAGGGDYSFKHSTNIPEPATILLLSVGGMQLLLKRKKR